MERLIKKVREHPILWDTNLESFRNITEKEIAWEKVAQESGMTSGNEARMHWKKLRDSHREAVRRRKKSKIKTPWKYEKQMRFVLPQEEGTSTEANDSNDSNNVDDSTFEDDNETNNATIDSPLRSPGAETDNKTQEQKRQDEMKSLIDSKANKSQDALSILFESMCQKTRELPKHLQLRVQREIFEVVLRAEEEALSLDPLASVHSPTSSTTVFDPSSDNDLKPNVLPSSSDNF